MSEFKKVYDKSRDVLFVYKEPKVPATSLNVAGEVWVRLTDDGEVVGFEVEDFEAVFLVRIYFKRLDLARWCDNTLVIFPVQMFRYLRYYHAVSLAASYDARPVCE